MVIRSDGIVSCSPLSEIYARLIPSGDFKSRSLMSILDGFDFFFGGTDAGGTAMVAFKLGSRLRLATTSAS